MKAIDIAASAIAPPPPVTHVALLVDNSGSMTPIMAKAKEMAQSQFDALAKSFADTKQLYSFDLWTIDSIPKHILHVESGDGGGHDTAVRMAISRMHAGGGTPLYRTIADASALIDTKLRHQRGDAAMVIVVTDGYDTEPLNTRLEIQDKARIYMLRGETWSFAVVGPPGVLQAVRGTVPDGNVLEWDGSAQQLETVSRTMGQSLSTYAVNRSKGIRTVTDYFTANLPSENIVKSTLSNAYQVKVRSVRVDAEEPIEDKVVRFTRKPYELGQAFFQLTKTEKIQPEKEIIIREKGSSVYYGGPNVRALLGLGKKEAKVTPGNFGNYDIFVQSTSVNRKLVRGTDLLIKAK